jgi:hydroxyacylglutathione hydrolase
VLQRIKTLRLSLLYRLGSANCYLARSDAGFVLIDTGGSNKRADLVSELDNAGCRPANLNLIVLTDGDSDHIGNCAFLRDKFGATAAMHCDDAGMVERWDMLYNRQSGNPLIRATAPILFRYGKSDRFKPDLYIEEGDDLSEYGLDARVLHLAGHSRGSIGVLTTDVNLCCGDLLGNTKNPVLYSIMNDLSAAQASVEKLRGLYIHTVSPEHGGPCAWELCVSNYQAAQGEESRMSPSRPARLLRAGPRIPPGASSREEVVRN